MRVLEVVTVPLAANGLSMYPLRMTSHMDRITADFATFSAPDATLIAAVEQRGGKVHILPHRLKRPLSYVRALAKLVKSKHYDVVHIHGNSATMAFDLMGAKLGGAKARIAHSHNSDCTFRTLHKLLHPLFFVLYTHAYACSDAAGKWLFKKRPFEICPNAIDTEMYSYRGDAKNDTVVFGMVGGITEVKNHIFALDVLPDDCELMIIGDGPLAPELKAKTADRHNIHWMGQRNDVHELIQHMDALLLPSLHEGLPTVVLEAQCAGLPVFCADTVSTMCAFTDKVTFLPLDKEEWRHALDAFTPIDRAENAEIAIAAMKAAGYDLRIAAQRMQETYLKLSPDGGKSNCQN